MNINRGKILWILILFVIISFNNTVAFKAQANENVKVEEQLVLINYVDEQFEVKELYQFINTGDESIQEDLIINLPEGADNIYLSKKDLNDEEKTIELDSNKYTVKSNKVTINENMNGGQSISLLVFYTSENIDTLMTLNYPTDKLYVFVPMGLNLKSNLLDNLGIEVLDQVHFQVFGNHNLTKRDSISLNINSMTVNSERVTKEYIGSAGFHSVSHLNRWANSPLAHTNPHLWLLFLVLLGLGFIFFSLLLLRKKEPIKVGDISYLIAKEERLLRKIMELDLNRNNKEIDKETYQELRKQYKQLLIKVKLRINSLEES
ncbi:MAG: hypothetical protein VR72_08310 [Clostridiaceae bacterium BRH_c20a]|nr:MAG: hypothetical protein VR72_08310 [Clostridiaceae bacterium BRH_c20a]